jgi:tetratricopeptide (TPR) repeat protein
VSNALEVTFNDARKDRAAGRTGKAEEAYSRAAGLARLEGDPAALAHALRHLSDLARERGAAAEARDLADEAVTLYREIGDGLGLANALRLRALSSADDEEARRCWQEACGLYSSLDVRAGVAECEMRLGT